MVMLMSPISFFCLTSLAHTARSPTPGDCVNKPLILSSSAVVALQCYKYETLECQWTTDLYQAACDDLENINKPPSTATEQQCPETDDRCFMVIATGENDDVGVSSISGECTSAAELGWETTDCRNAMDYQEHDVLGWHVTRGRSFGTDLTTAKVCVCDTDLCNGQNPQRTVTKLGVCLTLLITVWLNL